MLPFQNVSGDPEQEYFGDGIAEDIIKALSKLSGFVVIARNSTFAYKGKAPHIRQVAHELGVRYVLEGSVRKAGERLRHRRGRGVLSANSARRSFKVYRWPAPRGPRIACDQAA